MSDMRHTLLLSITVLAATVASCTQDEAADGTQFAEGKYPLVINTASIGSPATRATADGTWDGTETVYVQVKDYYGTADETDWCEPIACTVDANTGKLTLLKTNIGIRVTRRNSSARGIAGTIHTPMMFLRKFRQNGTFR